MKSLINNATASIFVLAVSSAHAASVSEVFTGDMLGTNQRYFESVAGIPRESNGNEHVFRVQGCNVTASIVNGNVTSLRLELGPKCQADLTQFISTYAPSPTSPLTVGAFNESSGGGMSYAADCLTMCGNAADPVVYALWDGPHAANFRQVKLEVSLTSDAAITAADSWKNQMSKIEGEDYVMDTKFNCDHKYDQAAEGAFKSVQVTAVTIGTELAIPGC
jgi:hypothetical protein